VVEPYIDIEHLGFRYIPGLPLLLEDVNLTFDKGTATVILGPNGAGKTTLLYLILGWLRPETGTVKISGNAVSSLSQSERGRLMSLVPQSEHIPFEYSMLEYVLLGRIPYLKPLELPKPQDFDIARQALLQVGLDPEDGRAITILSGGEKQLLFLARSLCQEPEILVLDEPSSHLDLHNKQRLLDILKSLHGKGMTIILTTHEPDFAVAAGDRATLMSNHRIVAAGSIKEIFTDKLLSEVYDSEIRTVDVDGRRITLWF
jgi:iron complex transport system ATP-binding protein